jgi:replicative DNA helicase
LTIDELVSVCRAKKRTGKLDLLVLDHLHLMPLLGDNRNNELALVTSKLKRLAIELDIHVCALAQLNRGVEQRQVKKPVMSDLRDSGGIEQDADFVLLLHRPAYYDDEANPALANIIISKNRNGETGEVDVCWEGIHQRFTNNLPFWQPPIKQQTKRQSMVI